MQKHINNQVNEYGCNTCKTNFNIEALDQFERTTKSTFIPLKIRRTKKIGIVFTTNSIMFNWHIEHGQHHDWFNLAEAEAEHQALKELQAKLDEIETQ